MMEKYRKVCQNPYQAVQVRTGALSLLSCALVVCSELYPKPPSYTINGRLGRFQGRIPQTPPFSILLARSAKSGGGFGRRLNWQNVLNIVEYAIFGGWLG
jgi:hypothetical protein